MARKELSAAAQIEAANMAAAEDAQETAEETEEEGLEPVGLELVEERQTRSRLPVIEGAIVVYMGSRKDMSLALVSSVYVNQVATGDKDERGEDVMYVTKECDPNDVTTQGYDFSTHDTRGRFITMWLTPQISEKRIVPGTKTVLDGAKLRVDLRGKPFKTCEHPEHLRRFMRYRNPNNEREFEVLVPPRVRQIFDQYVDRKERALRVSDQQLQETVK